MVSSYGHGVSDLRVQAVGLLIQHSDSEDETCAENDERNMRLELKVAHKSIRAQHEHAVASVGLVTSCGHAGASSKRRKRCRKRPF